MKKKLCSILVAIIFVLTPLSLNIVSATYYNVTKNVEHVNIIGATSASNDSDYSFVASPAQPGAPVELSVAIKGHAINKNTGEGNSLYPTFFGRLADSDNGPAIDIVQDTDSPMKDILTYKRVITDKVNAGTQNTFHSLSIDSIMRTKPTAVSFGFWIKESDVYDLFEETNGIRFWPVYNLSDGAHMQIEIPLIRLIEGVGTSIDITPYYMPNINNIFTNFNIRSTCLARSNGWAYISCDLENLTYAASYSGSGSLFYIDLRNISSLLRQEGKKIEMSNFTYLIDETIKSGYIVYPQHTNIDAAYIPQKDRDTYIIEKEAIAGDIAITAKSSEPTTIPSGSGEISAQLSGLYLYVRTPLMENEDLVQRFQGFSFVDYDKNRPFDWAGAGLVPQEQAAMEPYSRTVSLGSDESTPFKFNNSYIGANHGQSNCILVTAPSHGKTYADIGSLWQDSAGVKWNLLKVHDSNKLLFLSENISSSKYKYNFKNSLSGELTYVSHGKNTGNITVKSTVTYQQVFPSIQKKELSVYAISNGMRTLLSDGDSVNCDYLEIKESYNIMNPSLIGETLRANRPTNGYTEPQDLAIGEPLVEYNTTYIITSDGTVFSKFSHKLLQNVSFIYYGGIQYPMRENSYGGAVYRYVPKLLPFDHSNISHKFTTPYNMTSGTFPSNLGEFQLASKYWEKPLSPPDRQIDFIRDTEGDTKLTFTGGFLPVLGGESAERVQNINNAGFMYKTKKTYPYFVEAKAFPNGTKDQTIEGISFKKYSQPLENDLSYITIPYGSDTYVYIDSHKLLSDKVIESGMALDDTDVTLIEKSDNISYEVNNNNFKLNMASGEYGYLVLKVSKLPVKSTNLTADISSGEVFAEIENTSFDSQSVEVLVAAYNGKKLVEMKKERIDFTSQCTAERTYSFTPSIFTKVKLFVWNTAAEQTPVCRPLEG